MAVVLMSKAELSRVDTLVRVGRGELPVAGAASLLGLSERQVFRLLARFRSEGAAGLASRRRGRPSNRRLPDAVREAALAAGRGRYPDFGPTLAAEKLEELHDIRLSRETLRQWMSEAGLWLPRRARRGSVHQPRHRRDCLGELVQIDGCEGTVRNSVYGPRVEHSSPQATWKRSSNRIANWALAMAHSLDGILHPFSARFKTRKRSFKALSSLGKCPRALTARRSLAF